jgi:hypothetical protein
LHEVERSFKGDCRAVDQDILNLLENRLGLLVGVDESQSRAITSPASSLGVDLELGPPDLNKDVGNGDLLLKTRESSN